MGLAKAGNGMLIVADYGNNRVKVVDSVGTVTNLYGVSSNLWYTGPGTLGPAGATATSPCPMPGRCRSAVAERRALRPERHRLCH